MDQKQIQFVFPCRDEPLDRLAATIIPIARLVPNAGFTVVDDYSRETNPADILGYAGVPAEIVDRTTVLPPRGKPGAGAAMFRGLQCVVEGDETRVAVTCEADGSVEPGELVRMVELASAFDVVFASRWISHSATSKFGTNRKLLSNVASLIHRSVRMPGALPSDWTLFYRAYSRPAVEQILTDGATAPAGFSFQAWAAHRVLESGLNWKEVPVQYHYRIHGESLALRHLSQTSEHLWLASREFKDRILGRKL